MDPQEAQELLLGLADEALSGRTGEVVCLEAPEWPPLPAALRRDPDGRSLYTRPGAARYATTAQLSMEDKLVAGAQAQGAPRLPGEVAARRLGADPVVLEARLRGRAHDLRGYAAPREPGTGRWSAPRHPRTPPTNSARPVSRRVLRRAGQRPRTCPAAIRPSSNAAVPVVTTGSCAAKSRRT
jgi:hypothetical protein